MNINELNVKHTGLLFFDMLNVYYHGASEETKKRMKPVVDNAVRLMNAARQHGMVIYYAFANHRPDGESRSLVVTDTDMRLRPWPNGDCKPTIHGATEGSWEQKVIEEIAPRPEDYLIPKFRWSTFHQTYFDLALRSRGIHTLIVSGGAVDVGVASTVYAARDHDYNVIIVRDACSNSYEDSMKAFMDTVFPRMARVRTTDQVLEMIQPSPLPSPCIHHRTDQPEAEPGEGTYNLGLVLDCERQRTVTNPDIHRRGKRTQCVSPRSKPRRERTQHFPILNS